MRMGRFCIIARRMIILFYNAPARLAMKMTPQKTAKIRNVGNNRMAQARQNDIFLPGAAFTV